MRAGDVYGRVIPRFINQALTNALITVFGDGTQTRAFTYVTDMVNGLLRAGYMLTAKGQVINIGNNVETQIIQLAHLIKQLTESNSPIEFCALPIGDPKRRCPDITKAKGFDDLETSRVAKGTTYIAAQNVIQYLVALVFYVLIARLLSQAEVGEISLLFFFMSIFETLTQLAIPVATQKFVSENVGKGQIAKASAASKTTLNILLAISTPSLLLVIFTSKQLSLFIFGTEANIFVLIITFITAFILNFTALFGAEMAWLRRKRSNHRLAFRLNHMPNRFIHHTTRKISQTK